MLGLNKNIMQQGIQGIVQQRGTFFHIHGDFFFSAGDDGLGMPAVVKTSNLVPIFCNYFPDGTCFNIDLCTQSSEGK